MLREIVNADCHFWVDERSRIQGECRVFHVNGKISVHEQYRDGKSHGEYRSYCLSGHLINHLFHQNDKIVIDFLKEPEKYPSTDEEKTLFALKYGSGQFLPEN